MVQGEDQRDLGAWSSRDAVEAWQRSSAARNATLAAATERMLDLAAVRPGARVLDLGTGTGDQAFAAAARVGPQGHVLATDISAEMVAEAAAGAARAGFAMSRRACSTSRRSTSSLIGGTRSSRDSA